ncbi:MAG: adenosylcobinamide-GDP ribazoletransferase [Deltaproteobacteria bacterium]|jgi:adenosylcobinamide-GDP ribazoletransferase|nr:adenosylcobinamide-GDP ribazoletransferase [Deltaproteobacteria bacterium]
MKTLRLFVNVLAFLTILPLDKDERFTADDFGRFASMFPPVGLVLGLLQFLACFALAATGVPAPVAAIALVTLHVIVTRGFHLDGLADTMDALLSHRTREDKLRIMKDPHQGTFGVLAILLDVLLKTVLVGTLIQNRSPMLPAALILFPVMGRWSATVAAVMCAYVRREGGLSLPMVDNAGRREFVYGAVFSVVAAAAFGLPCLAAAAFTLVWSLGLVFVWNRTLGGITGDLLGASVELTEIAALLFLVMAAS